MTFFVAGDRVKLTSKGLSQVPGCVNSKYKAAHKGVVTTEQSGSMIKVLRDNRKAACLYHASFWQLDFKQIKESE